MMGIFSSPDPLFSIWMFHIFFCSTVNLPSPKFAIQIRYSDGISSSCCFVLWGFFVFVLRFWFLHRCLHYHHFYTGKKANPFVRITVHIYGENISKKSRMIQVSTRSWSAWLWSAGNNLWTFHKTELNLGSLGIWTDIGTWDCPLKTDHLVWTSEINRPWPKAISSTKTNWTVAI